MICKIVNLWVTWGFERYTEHVYSNGVFSPNHTKISGAFNKTGTARFAGVAFVAECWKARRRRAIAATHLIIAD